MPFDPGYDYKTHTLYRSIAADYQPKRAELEICKYIERIIAHIDALEAQTRARIAELDVQIAELEAQIAARATESISDATDKPRRGRNAKTDEPDATEETPAL